MANTNVQARGKRGQPRATGVSQDVVRIQKERSGEMLCFVAPFLPPEGITKVGNESFSHSPTEARDSRLQSIIGFRIEKR